MDEKICRQCHEPEGDLISPCRCTGSIKYVHRTCLDGWRSVSPNPQSFYECDICKFQYRLQTFELELDEAERNRIWWGKVKFGFLLARDLFGVLILLNVVVILLGAISLPFQPEKLFQLFFGDSFHLVPANWGTGARTIAMIYEMGGLLLLFCTGITGMFVSCVKACTDSSKADHSSREGRRITHYDYRYGPFWMDWYFMYFFWPHPYYGGYYHHDTWCCLCCYSCSDCRHAHSNGTLACGDHGGECRDSNGLTILGIVLLVVLAIIILMGLVFGIIFLVYITSKIIQRHIDVLKKRNGTLIQVVMDLDQHGGVPPAEEEQPISLYPENGPTSANQPLLMV